MSGRPKIKKYDFKIIMPCKKLVGQFEGVRCEGSNPPICPHYLKCLDFFSELNWLGWKEV
jgi:hypothetical protein